jgi:hypothetical protein
MAGKALLAAIVVVCLWGGPAAGEETLTVNGFFGDKAILTVDGEPVIFAVGEKKNGIALLETGRDYALVRVHGKEKKLFIDQAIPKNLVAPREYKQNSTAKSHIIDVRLLHQTDSAATFGVEYFYNGNEAERAWLTAKTQFHGKTTSYWTHTVTPLKPGRYTTTITVGMAADAPDSYLSDAVYFDLAPVSGVKIFKLVKEWKKRNPEKHVSADDADGRR